MGNNEFEKVRIKNRTSYYFDGPMKLEDFDIYNILIDGKSREKIFIYDISQKALIDLYVLDSIKQMNLFEFMMELDIMMLFTTELDILQHKKWHQICFFSLICKNQSFF